ncbi:Lipocalin-related protein and Bos/Can/Equ allergen [hydrothermal vent metagenome]|uniref:Lipocalin-related protein and Bos/Can/Equ allergen n=1 Tax=hydrothermal vent metagenome TaxID=652676 RepID=A0A3B0WFY1_9ZZZZ
MIFESFAESHSFFLWSIFILSIIFGIIVSKTNFCTMGAVSDIVNMSDYGRFRAWLLAIAVALIGTSVFEYMGMMNITDSFPPYRSTQLIYVENILGGFLFGIGMTFASGCGNKTLIRIGGGNIKSILVFFIIAVIAYYMTSPFPDSDKTLYSVLFYDWVNPLAISLESNQDIGALIGGTENTQMMRLVAGLVVAAGLLFYIFKAADFRSNKDNVLSGIAIGIIIVTAWYISSNITINVDDGPYSLAEYYSEWDMLAEDDEGKPATGRTLSSQSFTFANPIGQAYGYIKDRFDPALLTFGLISVFGIILGSLLWSLISRSFRFEWFVDGKDFFNHFFGAVLMGFGAVLALGCTVGQGITGMSTLALGSILTFISIIFSSALTMKIQYYKIVYEEEATFGKALITALVDMKLLPSAMRKLDAV